MADLTLSEVIARFRSNEVRIADFTNGNTAGYYVTVDGKKVETLPSLVTRLATAIAAANATADSLKGAGGAKLVGFGASTVADTLNSLDARLVSTTTTIAQQDDRIKAAAAAAEANRVSLAQLQSIALCF